MKRKIYKQTEQKVLVSVIIILLIFQWIQKENIEQSIVENTEMIQ